MHLKQLVLKGFKSFADRSVITLEPGISAVVGPNGSGKSNISDAVLWVLGERNAKNLRGQVMEDVIFAGSSARKSVGVAEVELVLDNSDGTLPVDYSEVSIARRMYRNGESEYLINGSVMRRMDVLDILHDTGLGTGTHSIISQGHLDGILQSKPEDRRALIEEAAGVLKHKQRKEKSQRKLEQMDLHLARVGDVVSEVTRQLGPLERKAKRAIAYKEVSKELAELNLQLAVDDLRTLQGKWESSQKREEDLQQLLAKRQEAIKEAESESEKIHDAISAKNAAALQISQKQRRASACVERFRSSGALLAERGASASDRIRDLERALEDNVAKRRDVYDQYDEAQAFSEGLDRTNALDRQAKEVADKLAEAQDACAAREAASLASKAKLEEFTKRESEARDGVKSQREAVDSARKLLDSCQDAERGIASEIKGLEGIERAANNAAGAARAWVIQQNEALNPLIEAISVEPEYESLVEHLLGGDLSALIADDSATVARIGHSLESRNKSGEVIVLLQDAVPARVVSRDAVTRIGIESVALIDKLTYPDSLEAAVVALLGDVVLCADIDDALVASQESPEARFATRSGAVVVSGKIVFGAPVAETADGALARTRRLGELREKLTEARAATENARIALDAARKRNDEAQKAVLALSEELASIRGSAKADEREARAALDKVASLKREEQNIARQKEKVAEQVEAYAKRIADNRARELARIDEADRKARNTIYVKKVAGERVLELLPLIDTLRQRAQLIAARLEEEAFAAQTASADHQSEVNAARKAVREARDAYDATNAQLSDTRIEKGRLEVQVDAAIDIIVHDCNTPMETAIALPPLENREEVEGLAFKLRRRITNMGTINPDAAEEYEALKIRSDYLTAQLDDLKSARALLARIDRIIDVRMKDDFINTFTTVNENFKVIFSSLFPGGTGELILANPDDLENTGVEVIAQPHGKKITKMTLMSGGEKSLVALALLFSVYATRSTPFYILDEVEAALDDSNLRRLLAYLGDLRTRTQLIMITHQRRTMEMADVLFGVSMQADGVTKVISQKLDGALAYAE